mmetsp:Transcript_150162/g.262339  ORF Transcript_150162/g.262339 Transcript_150162/m.262339 type:complete len:266 (+) Transcript_150162:1190-1987(+)
MLCGWQVILVDVVHGQVRCVLDELRAVEVLGPQQESQHPQEALGGVVGLVQVTVHLPQGVLGEGVLPVHEAGEGHHLGVDFTSELVPILLALLSILNLLPFLLELLYGTLHFGHLRRVIRRGLGGRLGARTIGGGRPVACQNPLFQPLFEQSLLEQVVLLLLLRVPQLPASRCLGREGIHHPLQGDGLGGHVAVVHHLQPFDRAVARPILIDPNRVLQQQRRLDVLLPGGPLHGQPIVHLHEHVDVVVVHVPVDRRDGELLDHRR